MIESEPANQRASEPGRNRWLKAIGYGIGLALLCAAVYAAWGQKDALTQGLKAGLAARWWLVLLALGLPLCNWLLTSVLFMLLMQPAQAGARRRVRFSEMAWLIGASWLFNYLPLSPGLFGRVAYHQRVNGISVKASAGAVVTSLVISAAVLGLTLGVELLSLGFFPRSFGVVWLLLLMGVVGLGVGWSDLWRGKGYWHVSMAFGVRCIDVLVWAARYWAVMSMLGLDQTVEASVGMAVVSQVAMLVPFLGNGLGLREWAVGLMGPALPSWFRGAGAMTRGVGLSVDLVNRACEVAVAVPVGLLSTAMLARRARRGVSGPAGPP